MRALPGILVLDVFLMCSSGAGIVTICPVEVTVQKQVNVTCAFGSEPVQADFRIALVRKINSSYEEENVLTCQWYKAEHLCTTLPGYTYQHPITNKAVLVVENVSLENLGTYTCQRVPSQSGDIPCEIKLSAPKEETKSSVPVIVGVCVSLTLTLFIIGISIMLYHRRKRSGMSREQEMSKVTMLSTTQKEPNA